MAIQVDRSEIQENDRKRLEPRLKLEGRVKTDGLERYKVCKLKDGKRIPEKLVRANNAKLSDLIDAARSDEQQRELDRQRREYEAKCKLNNITTEPEWMNKN